MLRHVKFANLPVADQDRALAFWRDKIGFTVATDEAYGEDFRWIELELPGAQTRIVFVRRRDETPSEQPDLILICDDVDQSFAELKGRGVLLCFFSRCSQTGSPTAATPARNHGVRNPI